MAVIEAIGTMYLEDDVALATFSSIPATYKHLQLRMSVRSTKVSTHGYEQGRLLFNGDEATPADNYSWHGISAGSSSVAAPVAWHSNNQTYDMWLTNTATQDYGFIVVDIYDYANTSKNTSFQWHDATNLGIGNNGGDSGQPRIFFAGGMWDTTAAVHSVGYGVRNGSHDLVRSSSLSLYGIND